MIQIYDKWASTSRSATTPADGAHGLSGTQISDMQSRFDSFMPSLATNLPTNTRSLFADKLPDGANWDMRKTAQSLSMSNNSMSGRNMVTNAMPYQPEFSEPSRQNYPVHRILANRYWRMFYKLDPIVGNCIELYSDLPWGNFELTGEGVEGEIRQAYEQMCKETQLLAILPYLIREFLVVGECCPHNFFDQDKGIFTYIALHNPDQLEVVDAPFIKMDPIIEFVPDDKLRSIMTSNAPGLQQIRKNMPPELVSKLTSRENITLSPINATFIPRKLHPYDSRGTSILSRLWSIFMYGDAIMNASIQQARRNASPLKLCKLGNAATGWIPPPEQEKRMLELLAQAEMDSQAWIVTHYGVQFETIGTADRLMGINKEWDVIERIKLSGLGISRAFMSGETTFASASTGLQVFLQRLKSLRTFFEQKWIYPKLFKPIAEINGWVRPKPNEVAHRYRVKRSAAELSEQNAYIIPKIAWDKSLDPQINNDLIQAMTALESLGVKFSKTTKLATAGFSFEEETKKIHREREFEKQFLPALPTEKDENMASGAGGGMVGGSPPPSVPNMEEDVGAGPPGSGDLPGGIAPPPQPPKPPGASVEADKSKSKSNKDKAVQLPNPPKPGKSSLDSIKSQIWVDDKYGNWEAQEISDLKELVEDLDTSSAFWSQLGKNKEFKKSIINHDLDLTWDLIEEYLSDQGYPSSDIDELNKILMMENILGRSAPSELIQLEQNMPDNADEMSDEEFASMVSDYLGGKGKSGTKLASHDNFLIGTDPGPKQELLSDISHLIGKK